MPNPISRPNRAAANRPSSATSTKAKLQTNVQRAIDRLTDANDTARSSGQITDRYDYLRQVYRLSGQFVDHAHVARIARILGGGNDADEHDRMWFIHRIMRLTSKDDRRLRSKYVAALTYAAVRKVKSSKVVGSIQGEGGLNACAERLRRRRRKGLLS